jgi:ubiquinol-cytochrome c reductase iron-sulfur subunit
VSGAGHLTEHDAGGGQVTIVTQGHPRTEEELARGEKIVAAIFTFSILMVAGFVTCYLLGDPTKRWFIPCLGIGMGGAFGGLGIGMVAWAKLVMPHEHAVQQRHPLASSAESKAATGSELAKALDEMAIAKRPLLRRTLLGASGALGLVLIVPLRSLAKGHDAISQLKHTAWTPGARMVTAEGTPIKLGDISIGGFATVFPEGFEGRPDSQTLLIRLRAGEDKPRPGRENWSIDNHVAYSKICTHVGCPVGLYEQQTHHLLCPCHQSTFNVIDGCRPIFGPAARSLPQLPIAVDKDGYFVAQSDYLEPVGPSYWERKPKYPEGNL